MTGRLATEANRSSARQPRLSRLDRLLGPRGQWVFEGLLLVAFILLLATPFDILGLKEAAPNGRLRTLTDVFVLALTAQSWNLIGGFTGYAAFGNVAFFGMGAYTTAILMTGPKWPLLPSVVLGGLVAAIFAAVIGLPLLRLKGHYFAIATLGVAEATREIAGAWDSVTGGAGGINLPIPRGVTPRQTAVEMYLICLGLVVLVAIFTWLLGRSKLGYGWVAIREDEDAARSLGVDTTRYKVIAFALSALVVGVVGGLNAYRNLNVLPDEVFKIDITLTMIIATVIGGPGSILGPVIGAAIYDLIENELWSRLADTPLAGLQLVFLGIVLISFIVFIPRGLNDYLTGKRRFSWKDLRQALRATRVD